MKVANDLLKHRRDFLRSINNHKYEMTGEGIYMPEQKAMIGGVYTHNVNGQDERVDPNLIVTEGLNHILDVVLHDVAKISTWYLTVSSGNVSPQATWTAANYTANATEITSNTEGYSETTRREFVEVAASAGSLNNTASKAVFTIATTTSVVVWGAALLSSNVKGGTSGTLLSASKFSASRTLYDTDVLNVGYTITLTST